MYPDREFNRLFLTAVNGDPKRHFMLAAGAYRTDGAWVQARNGAVYGGPFCRAHAEHRLAMKLTRGCDVFVVRVKKNGSAGLAKPCPACQRRLKRAGVRRVFYTVENKEAGILWL